MRVGVPSETREGETRVGLVPETVGKLAKDEHEFIVESGAGGDAYPDEAYEEAGARIVEDVGELYESAEIVCKVAAPTREEAERMNQGTLLICFLDPHAEEDVLQALAEQGVSTVSMAAMPRTGAAQSMDALSSMASIAGYQSVLMAAEAVGRYLPMMTTAAGTTKAAKVMVLGVGVAGLQAIATAGRLGADVEAFDIRPEVADQVRSLGATFIEAEPEEDDEDEEPDPEDLEVYGPRARYLLALLGLPTDFGRRRKDEEDDEEDSVDAGPSGGQADQGASGTEQDEEKQKADQALVVERIKEMDVVLTTANIPGKKAPTLVTTEMVDQMKPGAVLFDLAAESGGNCELSEPGEVVEHGHVRIHGPLNLPATMPQHASYAYSRNVASVLGHLLVESELELDFTDEITSASCLTHDGKVRTQDERKRAVEAQAEADDGDDGDHHDDDRDESEAAA